MSTTLILLSLESECRLILAFVRPVLIDGGVSMSMRDAQLVIAFSTVAISVPTVKKVQKGSVVYDPISDQSGQRSGGRKPQGPIEEFFHSPSDLQYALPNLVAETQDSLGWKAGIAHTRATMGTQARNYLEDMRGTMNNPDAVTVEYVGYPDFPKTKLVKLMKMRRADSGRRRAIGTSCLFVGWFRLVFIASSWKSPRR